MVSTPSLRTTPDLEAEAQRRIVRRAMLIGIWVWPSFTLLDAWMCFVAYPDAPFGLLLSYRIAGALMFVTAYLAAGRPTVPVPPLIQARDLTFGVAALGIALMAVHLGGIRSPYMHGISVVALVRAALVPESWRRSLPTYTRIGLAFPLIMGAGAVLSAEARAEWITPAALTDFGNNYVFVVASSFLGMVTGHLVWSAQQQVYRARRLGRYRLQAPIGKGGMGEVWLAWDPTLRRNVALKLLRVASDAGPESVQRFEREAYATSQLQGPHTVRIFDYGASDDGVYYIAMEYLTGSDLGTLVSEGGPLAPEAAISFVRQACISLEEAHAAGIIHRDIKPANLMACRTVDGQTMLKLLDFGIARFRATPHGEPQLTQAGMVAGTPAYMAPELWFGAAADERSDIYSLGVTLYFLVTGRAPHRSWVSGVTPGAAHHRVLPDLPQGVAIPESLTSVILRCLSRRPEDRYQSAKELRLALEAVAGSLAGSLSLASGVPAH